MNNESNPFHATYSAKQDESIEAYDLIWEQINTKLDSLYEDFRRFLAEIRATQKIPVASVEFSIYECSVLNRTLQGTAGLRKVDISDLRGRYSHVSQSLSYLNSIATKFRVPTAEETNKIMTGYEPKTDINGRLDEYELEIWLILLARPEGKEFWGLLRALWQRLQSEQELEDTRIRKTISDFGRMLHWIAPAKFFNDKAMYYPSNRYGHRTKNVEWIVPAGLPGLGKRA